MLHLNEYLQQSSTYISPNWRVQQYRLCDSEQYPPIKKDIGRHNALDKIYGHCLRNDYSIKRKIIAFSGRISSENFTKVSKNRMVKLFYLNPLQQTGIANLPMI